MLYVLVYHMGCFVSIDRYKDPEVSCAGRRATEDLILDVSLLENFISKS